MYVPDLVLGANDGIITTLAVVAGVAGASLSSTVVIVLGFANLLADGFSMGASNVLSRRSHVGRKTPPKFGTILINGTATFAGFVAAGFVPLIAYLVPFPAEQRFKIATILALTALFMVGASRSFFVGRSWFTLGMEMLLVGGLATAVAYAVGALSAELISGLALASGAQA
jgi:VIT1/CCC1 family predicted Fe2+/Mn2+ transporter